MRSLIMVLISMVLPLSSFAHGNRAEVLAAAVTAATKKFVAENPAQVRYYKGIKGWIQGTDLMIEIYQINTNNALTYVCKHVDQDGQMTIECRKAE